MSHNTIKAETTYNYKKNTHVEQHFQSYTNLFEFKLCIFKMKICWASQNQLQSRAVAEFMNNADDNIICYEAEYKVLICRQHYYAMWNLHDHLHDKHMIIGIEQHCVIAERYTQYELQKLGKMQQPLPLGPPIPALSQPIKALQCNDEMCEHISINCKTMQQHCNCTHD